MLDQHPDDDGDDGDDDDDAAYADDDDDLGLLLIVAQSLPEVSQGQVLNLGIQLSSVIILCHLIVCRHFVIMIMIMINLIMIMIMVMINPEIQLGSVIL